MSLLTKTVDLHHGIMEAQRRPTMMSIVDALRAMISFDHMTEAASVNGLIPSL